MAASHHSLDVSEPKGSGTERASDTERPPVAIPSISSAASEARLQAALSATSRADASLSSLMRAARELTSGVSTAREANVALVGELGALADLLGAANERQLALKNRVTYLEQARLRIEKEAGTERVYILEQMDAFIAGLVDEHERALAELRRELEAPRERMSQRPTATPGSFTNLEAVIAGTPTEPAPPDPAADPLRLELEATRREVESLLADRERTREALLRLQAQRDEAQASVARITRERDLARAEGAQNRIGVAVRQAIPVHTPTPTPAGRMAASTLPPPDSSPRNRPPSSAPRGAVASNENLVVGAQANDPTRPANFVAAARRAPGRIARSDHTPPAAPHPDARARHSPRARSAPHGHARPDGSARFQGTQGRLEHAPDRWLLGEGQRRAGTHQHFGRLPPSATLASSCREQRSSALPRWA